MAKSLALYLTVKHKNLRIRNLPPPGKYCLPLNKVHMTAEWLNSTKEAQKHLSNPSSVVVTDAF